MASLFHEEAGPQKYGEYVFEWLPLLQTPCYGFSGPNACYSTTCNHNPSLSKEPKLPNSTKMSFKFYMNAKKSLSNCERAADHTTYKSTLAVQMNAHGLTKRNTYEEDKPKFNGDVYYDGASNESRLLYDDSPVRTDSTNQFCEPSGYYCRPPTTSSSLPYVQHIQPAIDLSGEHTLANSSREIVVSAKKYTFNPLSKPFHPMRNVYTNSSASVVSIASSQFSSAVSTASTSASVTTKTTQIERMHRETKKFVCILCPEKYDTLAELKQHLANKVQQPHDCLICGMSFEHNYLFHRHIKQHRCEKMFRCRGCNKKFRSLSQLSKHFEFCRYKLYMFI